MMSSRNEVRQPQSTAVWRYRLVIYLTALILTSPVYADQNWNIRTAPVSDSIGIYNLELDYTLGEKFTIGPMVYRFDYELSDTTYESTAVGVRLNYYFRKVHDGGWLLGLSGLYGTFSISEINTSDNRRYYVDVSTRIYTLMLSYQALWENFNITTGIGVSYFSLPETVIGQNGGASLPINTSFLSGTLPNAEFTLGWRF